MEQGADLGLGQKLPVLGHGFPLAPGPAPAPEGNPAPFPGDGPEPFDVVV